MTADDFRRLALSFPDAVESSHMNHPDFRVQGRIFATLGYPGKSWAMVKLPSEDQESFVQDRPGVFMPVKGAWGRQGATSVRLEAADQSTLERALALAWHNAAVKQPKKPAPHKGASRARKRR